MGLVQIRDVDDATVRALRAHAAERGLTLAAYLRDQLDLLARRPTNAEIVERLVQRDRRRGPSLAETVALLRGVRDAS